MEDLTPLLDELVSQNLSADSPATFFRIQGLVSRLADVLLPHVARRLPPTPDFTGVHRLPSVPRWRQFLPLRREALAVEALLRSDIGNRWPLSTLCEHVHMSSQQLVRVFVEAFGKTPHAYLTMLRVEEMTRLLRETDMPIMQIAHQVGWKSRGHAAEIFRRLVGVTPTRYRRYGPPPHRPKPTDEATAESFEDRR